MLIILHIILHIPAVKQALLPWVENVCTDQIVVEAHVDWHPCLGYISSNILSGGQVHGCPTGEAEYARADSSERAVADAHFHRKRAAVKALVEM